MSPPRPTPAMWGAVAAAAAHLLVFAPWVARSGLYLDDTAFILMLKDAPASEVWGHFLTYVPGRNLQILFWFVGLKATGGSVSLAHALTLPLAAANTVLVYALVLTWTSLASLALPAALIFALLSNHGETHFWLTAFIQCQVPLFFALLAFWTVSRPRIPLGPRLAASLALYTLAFFTYDQIVFLWPLLLGCAAWTEIDGRATRRPLAAGAVYGLSLVLFHVLLRHLAPISAGGRPVIRWGAVCGRFHVSLAAMIKGMFAAPIPGHLPLWGTLAVAVAALAAACLALLLHRRVLAGERSRHEDYVRTPGPLRLAVFGGAWFLLSYLPNYFWYLAPRHNQIPSVGWALLWTGAVAWLASGRPRFRAALPWACGILLANAAAANMLEGSQWVRAAELHRGFLAAAQGFAAPADNVFLLGAPRYARRAPAFQLPHDTTLRFALASGARLADIDGEATLAPTLRGAFYQNDLSLFSREDFKWLPYERMNAVGYSSEHGFRCLAALELIGADRRPRAARLRPSPGCTAPYAVEMEVTLNAAERMPAGLWPPAVSKPPVAVGPGLELGDATLADMRSSGESSLLLGWTWRVRLPPGADLAVLPRITDAAGATVYEPVYPARERKNTPVLWPLTNDLVPASTWRAGDAIRETWILRTRSPLPGAGWKVEAAVYALSENTPPRRLGSATLEPFTARVEDPSF